LQHARASRRYAEERGAWVDPDFTDGMVAFQLRVTAFCYWCVDRSYLPLEKRQIDHRVPPGLGGGHTQDNVRIIYVHHNTAASEGKVRGEPLKARTTFYH
jgi:hypothetical protein